MSIALEKFASFTGINFIQWGKVKILQWVILIKRERDGLFSDICCLSSFLVGLLPNFSPCFFLLHHWTLKCCFSLWVLQFSSLEAVLRSHFTSWLLSYFIFFMHMFTSLPCLVYQEAPSFFNKVIALINYFIGHIIQCVGSSSLARGQTCNHWTAREVLEIPSFYILIFFRFRVHSPFWWWLRSI